MSLDITVVPLFAFFIMKNPPDSATDLVASVERHAEVDAIRRATRRGNAWDRRSNSSRNRKIGSYSSGGK